MCIDKRIGRLFGLVGLLVLLPFSAGAVPKIESWTTSNGARVLFVPAPEIPMLDIRVVFNAGGARDGDTPGLMMLVNGLLSEGAGRWNADQIAERLEGVGAELGNSSLRDMAWVSLRTLTEPNALEIGLETLTAVVGEPRFDTADLERLRQQMLANIEHNRQSPSALGKAALYREVFPGHPYGSDPDGSEASVKAITRDQVVAAYERLYVARNALVALVGALDRAQAEEIAERVTSGLAAGTPAAQIPPEQAPEQAVAERIPFPSSQSHLYLGLPAVERGHPDHFALYVGNHVLGGSGLVSLLSEEVREKRGFSYSVYSYFSPMQGSGIFVAGLQTRSDQVQDALKVVRETIDRFIDEGPTAEQLAAAKRNIVGGFPLQIASNRKIIDYIAMIGFYDLPLDYLETLPARIEAVTADEVKAAFRRWVKPERMVTVIAGGVAEAAAALN